MTPKKPKVNIDKIPKKKPEPIDVSGRKVSIPKVMQQAEEHYSKLELQPNLSKKIVETVGTEKKSERIYQTKGVQEYVPQKKEKIEIPKILPKVQCLKINYAFLDFDDYSKMFIDASNAQNVKRKFDKLINLGYEHYDTVPVRNDWIILFFKLPDTSD